MKKKIFKLVILISLCPLLIYRDFSGLLLSGVIFLLYVAWLQFRFQKKEEKFTHYRECALFMKYAETGYYYQSREHDYLQFAMTCLDSPQQEMIAGLANDEARLNRLQIYFDFPLFSVFRKILDEDIVKADRLNALRMIRQSINRYYDAAWKEKADRAFCQILYTFLEFQIILVLLCFLFSQIMQVEGKI